VTRFRRAIAIAILALFTCQSILAGVDEHMDHASASAAPSGAHEHDATHDAAHTATLGSANDAGAPHSTDLIDGDCCHAHGHCHLLAFTGQLASSALPSSRHADAVHDDAYNALFPTTLLRPPTHA